MLEELFSHGNLICSFWILMWSEAACGVIWHWYCAIEMFGYPLLSWPKHGYPGIILCMRPTNERQRYSVTPSLIGWVVTENDIWIYVGWSVSIYSLATDQRTACDVFCATRIGGLPLQGSRNIFWNYPPLIVPRTPHHNCRPPVIMWRTPVNNFRPSIIIWGPPVKNWWPPDKNRRSSFIIINWRPPSNNWWPGVINWCPPYDSWWPPGDNNWRIVSENISPMSPGSHRISGSQVSDDDV